MTPSRQEWLGLFSFLVFILMVILFFLFRGPNSWSHHWFLLLHPSSIFQHVLVALIPSMCWELFIPSSINICLSYHLLPEWLWSPLHTSPCFYICPLYSQSTSLNNSLKKKKTEKKTPGLIITVLCIQNFNGPCFTLSKSLQGPTWYDPLCPPSCLLGLLSHYFPGHPLFMLTFSVGQILQTCFCCWASELLFPLSEIISLLASV